MEGEHNRDREVAPALIAVDPAEQSVAVAVGSDLRVFDLRSGCPASLADDSGEPYHKDSIRAISYSRRGKLLVSAGDDKLVKIWSTGAWRCICTILSEKRVSALAISNDGMFVCFADKFGVVWVVDGDGCHENQALASKKAVPILSHYCSIITSLEFSPDGRFIVSADRDFKIRVTTFPNKPLDGAHEIQSFCLGHTEFVSCLAFVCASDFLTGLLVSGSGDSTVRLWDIISGSLLDTCEVGAEVALVLTLMTTIGEMLWYTRTHLVQCQESFVQHKAGLLKSNRKEEELFPAVTDLCAIPNSSLVAVSIQSLSGIVLLRCNISDKTLALGKVISITGEVFIPTSLGISFSGKLLWVVTGVSNLQGIDSNSLTRVRAVSGFSETNPDSGKLEPKVLEDNDIPCGVQLLEKLQGGASIEKEVFVATAETLRTAMHNLLVKKQYTAEKREFRKRGRNDRKTKQ